jgi:hypothetical protein
MADAHAQMGTSTPRHLAVTAMAAAGAIALATIPFAVLDRSRQPLPEALGGLLVLPLGYTVLGVVIVLRQARNAIGWLYIGLGLILGFTSSFATSYAIYVLLIAPGSLPAGDAALWVQSPALDSLGFLMLILLLLLFPDGRPLTRRWRIGVWLAGAGGVLGLAGAFQTFNIDPPLDGRTNPYKASGAIVPVLDAAGDASSVCLLASAILGIFSVVLRFRRSAGIERQQLRWFAAAVVGVLTAIVVTIVVYLLTGHAYDTAVFLFAAIGFPAATGLAILRYRLYGIDVLIRKTLVYAVVIACLAVLYLAAVVSLGWVTRLVAGQSSTVAVTSSTLLVALAFQPLRRRVQRGVDRRFYRSRYDATRELDDFAARLRAEVEMRGIQGEFLAVVERTVQPSHVSLWLAAPPGDG